MSGNERLFGQMMDVQLTLHHLFRRNQELFGSKEIISYVVDPPIVHRYTYADFQRRVRKLANVLISLGVKRGDRIATFAYNHYQHLELYFAIPLIGAVLHTVNIRLFSEQLTFIFNHAEDKLVFVDPSLVSTIETIQSQLSTVKRYIVLGQSEIKTNLHPLSMYEDLLKNASDHFEFPTDIHENEALGLCYTSGTTGHPKGVLYSHRSTVLAAIMLAHVDFYCVSEKDVLLPVVPMFHVHAWGYPFAAVMNGSTLVFTGKDLTPKHVLNIILEQRVTFAAAVPTVWVGVIDILKRNGVSEKDRETLKKLRIITGGSAVARSLIHDFYDKFGVTATQAWGMTETSPIGTVSRLKGQLLLKHPSKETFDTCMYVSAMQGMPVLGIDLRIVDTETGNVQPWNGSAIGEIQVRGPFVAASYYKNMEANGAFTKDGWFRTGDVACIDKEGYMKIMDRTKDLIKSGGEWISSLEIETLLLGHPHVFEAAVVAIPHEKFQERPLAIIVPQPEHAASLNKQELTRYLSDKTAKWCIPDEFVFVKEIPKTGVGKFDKKLIRERYKNILKSKL